MLLVNAELVNYLGHKYRAMDKVGQVTLCKVVGCRCSSLGWSPSPVHSTTSLQMLLLLYPLLCRAAGSVSLCFAVCASSRKRYVQAG